MLVLCVNVLTQSGIDCSLVFGMPEFEPFQHISVKPQGYRLLNGPEESPTFKTCKISDFGDVGKVDILVLHGC